MQNKILIDNFDYRIKLKESGLSFATPGVNNLPFDAEEKNYYISKILNSLFIHDSVVIRITSIFDLIQLFGLEDSKLLIDSKLIEVIDDGGIVKIQSLSVRDNAVLFPKSATMK
jgi:hypothetical protein